MYKVKVKATKNYSVIGINEYCIGVKWTKLKPMVGNKLEPLNDEQLTDFINTYNPDEINLFVKDKLGNTHNIDFVVDDFKV